MKILLMTADPADVSWGAALGMLDGVMTSPALLAARRLVDAREALLELTRLVHGPVYASVRALDVAGAYRDGRELARLSDQIIVQIPLVQDTLGAMSRLRADGIRVATTHVFNAAQALLAARAGASSVVIALDRLDAAGHDALDVIRSVRTAFDGSHAECDLIAVSPASPTQFGAVAMAGADAVALDAEQCRSVLSHPLTDRGVADFVADAAVLDRSWPPSH